MTVVTLTTKGQVTIPVEVRRALGLDTSSRLLVTFDSDMQSLTMSKVLTPRELAARTSRMARKDVPAVTDADAYYQAHRDRNGS